MKKLALNKKLVAFDCEVYLNYAYFLFKTEDKSYYVRLFNDQMDGDMDVIRAILKRHTIITFNGNNYDFPILGGLLSGYSNLRLKKMSDTIIKERLFTWQIPEYFPDLRIPQADHIDLIGVTPLQASLKTYACRIHSPKLQDLPIHPDSLISDYDANILERYCENDVDSTMEIYLKMLPDIELRQNMGLRYEQDFRSKSGPQIAEAVIKYILNDRDVFVGKREDKVKPFQYHVPDFIHFNTPELNALLEVVRNATFSVDKNGYVQLPEELDKAIEFKGATYKMGIGGLHSQEKKQAVVCAPGHHLGEFDVASMYPSIILGQGLYPKHLGPEFLNVYRDIFNIRIAAKNSGDKFTSESLKLVLNSSYGKFGNRYSFLYSPELLIQTTITGQLALFMLIENLSDVGDVVSANTDGVVVHFDKTRSDAVRARILDWTERTTYQLEWTPYKAIYSESVNSYIALKVGGGAKRKGIYASGSIAKGYANEVCVNAVVAYLEHGTPIEDTIYSTTDVTKFLTMRGVRGGGVWRGDQLGKVVRWYVSKDGEEIRYGSNGNKVAGSDGAIPMMNLESLPANIDYDWYITKANSMLEKIGARKTNRVKGNTVRKKARVA